MIQFQVGETLGYSAKTLQDGSGFTVHNFVVTRVLEVRVDVHEGMAIASDSSLARSRELQGDNGWAGYVYGVEEKQLIGNYYSRTQAPEKRGNRSGDVCSSAIVYLFNELGDADQNYICSIEPPIVID